MQRITHINQKPTRHGSGSDFLKGQTENIVVSSRGIVQLGRAAEVLVEGFGDACEPGQAVEGIWQPWSINSIVVNGGTVYIGTSPNGGVYKYSLGKLAKIYSAEPKASEMKGGGNKGPMDANEPNDANVVDVEEYLANEHIFAMSTDVAGRLLVGISGERCRLCRFERGEMKTLFEPNDANEQFSGGGTKYVFAIVVDESGDIYLGTGPEGKVYRLDSLGREPQLLYDSSDKNILSLVVGGDGFIYAGSDSRGLIYKINSDTGTATVLYDSDQAEVTALLFVNDGDYSNTARQAVERVSGVVYAAATSAKVVQAEAEFAEQAPLAGRPELKEERQKDTIGNNDGLKLKIANIKNVTADKSLKKRVPVRKEAEPSHASYVYKITSDGFVTDVFSETAVFFCLAEQNKKLLIGTGNKGRMFTVEPATEQEAVIYEDEQASQITAVAVAGEDLYLGTANPAKLIKLSKDFASAGTYASALIDASQPAKWGKLQIEGDIPEGCSVQMASRSGNVEDINDPTFSDWTELVEVTGPVQLQSPVGRFCQYKLVFKSEDGQRSPVVREVAVAHTVRNLAPKVESVSIDRLEEAGKMGVFKISYKATDDNEDKLIYKIYFRKIGRTNWIELEDELELDSFEWDAKTVEDGQYEVKVVASDERGNTTATKLTGSRVSDPIVVDNTGPVVEKYSLGQDGGTVKLTLKVSDELSAIGQFHYTVDSNAEWIAAVPDDFVYDTLEEDFTVVVEQLQPGEHIISVKVTDDVGNTTYKTFEL